MANITKRTHKDGTRAYTIRVYQGIDPQTGKQLKPYTMTWTAPSTWSDAKAEKEAKKQANIFENECKSGMISNNRSTFFDYAKYIIELKENQGLKHKTVKNYKESLIAVSSYIGHLRVSDIRPSHLNKMYVDMLTTPNKKDPSKTLSPKTVLERHRFVSAVLSQAEKEGVVRDNIAKRATPPVYKRKTPTYYQPDVVQKIAECLELEPLKWKLFVHLLLITGARRGEIVGMEWARINYNQSMIGLSSALLYTPEKGVYKDSTKEDNPHWVKVPFETMELIKKYRTWWLQQKMLNGDRWQGSDYIFIQNNGKPMHPDSANTWLDRFAKKHGLPHLNPHSFRHTHASILYFNNVDHITVSHRLGHKQVSTTENIYAHIIQEAEEAAAECVANSFIRPKKCSTFVQQTGEKQ